MIRQVKIEKAQNGTTAVYIDGYDITPYITEFSLSQSGCTPLVLTLTIPATSIQMPDDFLAFVEIKKI